MTRYLFAELLKHNQDKAERPVKNDDLMEEILDPGNLREALKRVKANRGSAGIDRIAVEVMSEYLEAHWPEIRDQLLKGTYKPQPVLRVEVTRRRGSKAWNHGGCGLVSTAGGNAITARQMGPDFLGA